MRPSFGVSPSLNRKRFGLALAVTLIVTMALAVAVNFIGLSEGGRMIAYGVIMTAGIIALFAFVSKTPNRR